MNDYIEVGPSGRVKVRRIHERTPVREIPTRQEILDEAEGVALDLARIRAQVDDAKSAAAAGEGYSDRGWYQRASAALRFKGRRHQELLRRAAELRDAENSKAATDWRERFVAAARRRLNPETFQAILDEARDA